MAATPKQKKAAAQRRPVADESAGSMGWIIGSGMFGIGLVVFLLFSAEVLSETVAVTTVGLIGLLGALYYGTHNFLLRKTSAPTLAVVAVVSILWLGVTAYPFYRCLNPGTPVFTGELTRGNPVTVPLGGRAGLYKLFFSDTFLPIQQRQNRTAVYAVDLRQGAESRQLTGTFSQEWRNERVGSGRRSTQVQVLHTTADVREDVVSSDGSDLDLTLASLSEGVREQLQLRVYSEPIAAWLLYLGALVVLLGSIVVDALGPTGLQEGLMSAATVGALVAVVVFDRSTTHAPGFPQLVISALVGSVAGGISGAVLGWISRPLRQYLPAAE